MARTPSVESSIWSPTREAALPRQSARGRRWTGDVSRASPGGRWRAQQQHCLQRRLFTPQCTRGIDDQDEARNSSGQGRVLFHLTPTTTLSGRIYAANSRLQLNNSPQAIGTLPTGIIEAIPLSIDGTKTLRSRCADLATECGSATFIPAANDPDNLRKANFFSGALVFTQRPTEAFGYTFSYQGLATNRSAINGPWE